MSPPLLLARFRIPDYFYFIFGVCCLVSFCIVLFYAKRHPNPHFRPKKSDIGLVSFFLLFMSGAISFIAGGAFDSDLSEEKLEREMQDARRMANATGTSVEEQLGLSEGEGETEILDPDKARQADALNEAFGGDAPKELIDAVIEN